MINSNREEPHNLEAEQSVLGAMLLNKEIVNIASNKLKIHYFFLKSHQIIFESMINIHNDNMPIDMVTISEDLKNRELLDQIGGIGYLTRLSTVVPTISNANYYINIILDKYISREGIRELNKIIEKLYLGKLKDVRNDFDSFKSLISNNGSAESRYINASNVKRRRDSNRFISTGFKALDSLLSGGFKSTSLTILTGEPGSGKSTIINQMIAESISNNFKCLLYSGELPASDLMLWFKRTVANEYHLVERVSMSGNIYKDINDYCWDLISDWIKDKLFIYDDDIIADKKNILETIENLVLKKDVKLFVLDNLMTMNIGDDQKQYREQKQLCLSLKQLAKKYGLAIVLVAHPKKPMGDNKPSMFDVSGASEIVNSADTVLRIVRPKEDIEGSKILLLKNRWGGVTNKAIKISFDLDRKRYYTDGSELIKDYGYDLNKKFVQAEINSPF